VSNTSHFDLPSPVSSIYSQNSRFAIQLYYVYLLEHKNENKYLNIIFFFFFRRYIQPTQQRHQGNGYTRNTQYIILLFITFFVVIFGLYFTSIQSSTIVLPSGNYY